MVRSFLLAGQHEAEKTLDVLCVVLHEADKRKYAVRLYACTSLAFVGREIANCLAAPMSINIALWCSQDAERIPPLHFSTFLYAVLLSGGAHSVRQGRLDHGPDEEGGRLGSFAIARTEKINLIVSLMSTARAYFDHHASHASKCSA